MARKKTEPKPAPAKSEAKPPDPIRAMRRSLVGSVGMKIAARAFDSMDRIERVASTGARAGFDAKVRFYVPPEGGALRCVIQYTEEYPSVEEFELQKVEGEDRLTLVPVIA